MSLSGLKAKLSLPHRRNRDKPDANESIQPSSSSSTDKTSVDRRNQPAAGGVSPSQPSQISDNKLDVICIPCNENHTVSMSRTAMSLVSSIGMDDSNMSETLLKRIPYVPKDSFAFIWSRRTLLSIRDKHLQDIDRKWHADYMMYVCLDEDAGLARNKYLELVSGLHVYGDALLFKVKRGGLAKLDRAEYVNMDEDFGRDWRSFISANNILRKLLDPQFQDKILIQPYMKILTSVDAFRLPCDHSTEKNPNCLANVPLVGMDTKAKGHREVETRLRQVPDLRSYEGRKNFDWTRRKVVKVSYRKDNFVIYMCLDKDAKLPVNQSLKKWPKFSTPCCYGDAFIFKVHPGTGLKDTSSPVKYHHIGKDTTTDCGQKGSLVLRILEEVFHEIRLIPEEMRSTGQKS